jgi:hypothetical protein
MYRRKDYAYPLRTNNWFEACIDYLREGE